MLDKMLDDANYIMSLDLLRSHQFDTFEVVMMRYHEIVTEI